MKTRKFKCLGVESSKEVPASLKELMALNLTEEQVVDTAVNQILYHVFLGDVRDKVQEAFEEEGFERPFEYAKDKEGKDTKAKKYSQSVEKWLEELVGGGEISEKQIADVVGNCVADCTFKATSPREKKDPEVTARLTRAEAIMKLAHTDLPGEPTVVEKFAEKCKRNDVEAPTEWTKEAIAKCLLLIDTAI